MALGRMEPFDITRDNWNSYIDRLEQYFVVNDVKDAMKVPILITLLGSDAYELLDNLCTPVKPHAKKCNELVAIMKNHLQPKPSLLAERFKFRQCVQKNCDSVTDYVAELKKLSKECQFTADNLKENLRDQFVCGLRSDSIRQVLFAEDDIQFDKAFKIATSMEAAETDAALVEERTRRGDATPASASSAVLMLGTDPRRGRASSSGGYGPRGSVRPSGSGDSAAAGGRSRTRMSRGGGGTSGISGAGSGSRKFMQQNANDFSRSKSECMTCGGNHDSKTCKFQAYVCKVCNKQGHLKKMCPNLRGVAFHNVTEEEVAYRDYSSDGSDEVNNFSLITNSFKKYVPYTIDVCIEGCNLTMEIDTGSSISCISKDCYDKLFAKCTMQDSDLTMRYYTGEAVKPLGKITPLVSYNNIKKQLDLYIVQHGKTSLLGRQWLKELEIDLKIVSCHSVSKEVFNLKNFSSRYCDVFADGLGRFTGGKVGFRLREDARPVFLRARPLAYALREPVEELLTILTVLKLNLNFYQL